MKKFLVLYRMDMTAMQKLMAETSAEERKKSMGEWGAWMKNHMKDLADVGGPTSKNWEISKSGSVQKSNDIGGYGIVQAESIETAIALLKDNPHFEMPGAVVDIAEIIPMGM